MKTGFVGLVGLPNAGKSTIVNALIGEKVGIVSRKPQTTRKRVIGIYTESDAQICFVDSPGRIKAEAGLNSFLQKELDSVIEASDACLAVVNLDARKLSDLIEIVELTKSAGKPWAIVINKSDLDKTAYTHSDSLRSEKLRHDLLSYGVPVIALSALSGRTAVRDILLPIVKSLLPDTEKPLFTDDIYTTQSTKDLVAEIVREQCFEYLHQEVPYGLAVKVLKYDESHPTPRIFVEIIVTKENFVSMVVGKGGSTIKRIGSSARIECERVLGQKIYLETHVKLKKDWVKNADIMKELGYVTPE
jgi:GTPase